MDCDLKAWSWNDFDEYDEVINKYMPYRGEGDSVASQAVTAVNKLVYKFFNDGDVFDNNYILEGWVNNLSSYANWLAHNINGAEEILDDIERCTCCDDYAYLLWQLCELVLCNEELLETYSNAEKIGSIYSEKGKYSFTEC